MKTIGLFFLLPLLLFITGCPARSVQPLFNDRDIAFLPSLAGTWFIEDETYIFEQRNDNSYHVIYQKPVSSSNQSQQRDSIETTLFTVYAGKLGNHWFLDSYPAEDENNYHMLPTHLISKIHVEKDTMFISFLEGDWLKTMIDTHALNIDHIVHENDIVLTASTKELQRFVRKYADNSGAFPNPGKFIRKH